MKQSVLIIGGGITGLKTAMALDRMGIDTIIIEKSPVLGGKVAGYSSIFPDFRNGGALVNEMVSQVKKSERIIPYIGMTIASIENTACGFKATLSDGSVQSVRAIVIACGFDLFDPTRQMEYGYGVYPNVITSIELEAMLNPEGPTRGEIKRPNDGKPARRVAIIFCVGSRNMKIGNPYCSRICCSYGTKQAIEIKKNYANSQVTCFYMDIRTYGRGFEEMYQTAQEMGVKYIRGRVSECSQLTNYDIQIRAENTLLSKPVQGIFDLVSLSVGMMPCADAEFIGTVTGASRGIDGFFTPLDQYNNPFDSSIEGVFLAGSSTGLKPIKDCLLEGEGVAGRVAQYLLTKNGNTLNSSIL